MLYIYFFIAYSTYTFICTFAVCVCFLTSVNLTAGYLSIIIYSCLSKTL